MVGLVQSSFLSISALVFQSSFDHSILLRVIITLGISVLFLAGAAGLNGNSQSLRGFLWRIPFIVIGLGSLGLVSTLFRIYRHRQPHSLNDYEISLLIAGVVVFLFCIWSLNQSQKKSETAAGQFTPSDIDAPKNRILHPAPRPYIISGIFLGGLAFVVAAQALIQGKSAEGMEVAGCVLTFYGILCLFISRQKIMVANDYIAFKKLGQSASAVYFKDISRSVGGFLAERNHLLYLDIFTRGHQQRALRIPLKSFRQPEVAWLLSITELKVLQ